VSFVLIVLAQLIHNQDPETQENTLACLQFISDGGNNDGIVAISSYSLVPKILKFINHPNERIAFNAIKCIGNLARGESKITRVSSMDFLSNS